MVDEKRFEIEEANRNAVKTQVIHDELLVGAESTVEDGTIVRIPISKVIIGHIRIDILFSFIPRFAPVTTERLIAHNVEAILLPISKGHPLSAGSIATVLSAMNPLVGYKAKVGSFHDVICNLGLDALGDGLNGIIHGNAVLIEEEPSCAEELGNQ